MKGGGIREAWSVKRWLAPFGRWAEDLLSDEDDPEEPFYDPVHLAAVIVVCLVAIGVLYWLLWTLLVYEGGLPVKIVPALQVLFTSKQLVDFGYEGWPYELGVFEGWIGNLCALGLAIAAAVGIWRLFRKDPPATKG